MHFVAEKSSVSENEKLEMISGINDQILRYGGRSDDGFADF